MVVVPHSFACVLIRPAELVWIAGMSADLSLV
jgi:hypothetical protein